MLQKPIEMAVVQPQLARVLMGGELKSMMRRCAWLLGAEGLDGVNGSGAARG
jgi:hypothetical protein